MLQPFLLPILKGPFVVVPHNWLNIHDFCCFLTVTLCVLGLSTIKMSTLGLLPHPQKGSLQDFSPRLLPTFNPPGHVQTPRCRYQSVRKGGQRGRRSQLGWVFPLVVDWGSLGNRTQPGGAEKTGNPSKASASPFCCVLAWWFSRGNAGRGL